MWIEDESGGQLVFVGMTDIYSQGLLLVFGEMFSVEICVDVFWEGVLLGFDLVVVWN